MSDKLPNDSGAPRPTGKRQLSGANTTSSEAYESKRSEAKPEPENDKPGGGVLAFLPEVVSETRKVVWPTGREMLIYTSVVLVFLIIMTAVVWGVDTLTTFGVEAVLTP